ncbi:MULTISPECIES: ABC transporter substrate-binding protein [unclassified Haloferax]|uniref:ABC transporter substrate-binding protein n=1 Tax=unclassified Haloferax TaxID=2625095 RepID=UPI0002AF925B|nr:MULTISPECIES: ABC transporter substrate-binding protein [unclassified Haloferax]ELZ59249.1 iron ABC transporter substrate-binding protein [Haloferax sp. ATCC BAA-646]ELZ59970.1 iron ABC transporter substrate-binding protein [Haloferax sp. ATCC BAA-645]ELZ72134.1 iron ABC transporter substrate-binding protein [Haloferax sp. ATCC BAA-644]
MDEDLTDRATPTRRACLKGGGALLTGGLLAGCAGQNDAESSTDATETAAATTTTDASPASETVSGSESTEYTVSMSPAGDVTFESVPESVMVYNLVYADAAVAFGHGDAVNSLGFDSDAGGRTLDAYYERLDGVSFDRSDLAQLNSGSGSVNIDKELVYELDSDLHLVDPALVASFDGWDQSDVEEIREQVAPWFGNAYSRTHAQPPEPYADNYEYYTLWEIVENVGQVFREEDRYAALESVHSDLLDTIRSDLPPESERPTVGVVIYMDETFYPTKIDAPGFATSHIRPLGVTDAFAAGDVTFETSYDFEAMLEIDPDVLLHSYGIDSYYDVASIRETLEDHPIGSELSAVQNDRVYPSGTPVQGPIMNLFQLEMTAKQLYPDQFGAWPEYTGGAYPEIPEEERLFDRQRVADIVTGE